MYKSIDYVQESGFYTGLYKPCIGLYKTKEYVSLKVTDMLTFLTALVVENSSHTKLILSQNTTQSNHQLDCSIKSIYL